MRELAESTEPRHLPLAEPLFGGNEAEYVLDCIRTGWVSGRGSYVQRFEEAFAAVCGVPQAIATSTGTAALHLALAALGLGPGDEVIVPSLTFVACASAVRYTGATPVFADSSPASWSVDPASVRAKLSPRTKAAIAVHLYGIPAPMADLMQIAAENEIAVIEDASQAHGAKYQGKPVGSLGQLACFSFFGNKIVTTGEGGITVTADKRLADKCRHLRNHATLAHHRYWHDTVAFNYRMTNLQAAVGLAQLEQLPSLLRRRAEIAQMYFDGLRDVTGLEATAFDKESVCWLYPVRLTGHNARLRDAVIEQLAHHRIQAAPFFVPMHRLPPFADSDSYPNADRYAREGLLLPTSPAWSRKTLRV